MKQNINNDETASIVVPVCNEEQNIEIFYQRITDVMETTSLKWQVIFVEDSSTDRTVEKINEICNKDKRICAIFLTRRFGHHEAITAGIDYASGDIIIMMDGDLQHPPEVILRLLEVYNQGNDMVYAKRLTKEPFLKQLGSSVINILMGLLSDYPIDLTTSIFRIFNRKVADTLISMRERRRFITGMLSWPGFKTATITFEEPLREKGETKYNFRRMLDLAFGGLTSYSVKPLRFGIYLGFIISLISFLIGLYYILKYLIDGTNVPGFTSVIVSMFLLGGIILFVIGIIGEYIGNIFIEIKARPIYVVKNTLNIDKQTDIN